MILTWSLHLLSASELVDASSDLLDLFCRSNSVVPHFFFRPVSSRNRRVYRVPSYFFTWSSCVLRCRHADIPKEKAAGAFLKDWGKGWGQPYTVSPSTYPKYKKYVEKLGNSRHGLEPGSTHTQATPREKMGVPELFCFLYRASNNNKMKRPWHLTHSYLF